LCGIAELPFWPGEKYSSASRTSVRRDDPERREKHRMAVAWNDLRRDRLDRKAERFCDMLFYCRRNIGEGSDRTRDGACRNSFARGGQALAIALEFGIGLGKLETEGGGLGMDAVASANGWRHLVLECAALEHLE
jgi:hypothetical protein